MKTLAKLMPPLMLLLSLVIIAQPLIPRGPAGAYDLDTLGQLPVSSQGRTKPLDSVARNSLMIVSDRQTAVIDGKRQPAIRWLIDVIARPVESSHYEVFRIDHPDVRSMINAHDSKQRRFSFDLIGEHEQALRQQAILAEQVKRGQRTVYQRHLLELFQHTSTYLNLREGLSPYALPPLAKGEEWRPLKSELHAAHEGHEGHAAPSEAGKRLNNIFAAYRTQDPQRFNREVALYADMLDAKIPDITRKARFEVFFNKLQPFYQGTVLYVLAFLLGCGSLLTVGVKGSVWSATSMGVLLWDGIGDTIRVSLTPKPGGDRCEEVYAAQEILQSLGLRAFAPSVTACPGCGRTTSTVFQELAEDIQAYVRERMAGWKEEREGVEELSLAVMGCIVNGPGESKAANIGISLPGTGEEPTCPVFIDGERVTNLKGPPEVLGREFRRLVDEYVERKYPLRGEA